MAEQRDSISVLVDDIIRDAVGQRSSDIHAEPLENGLRIRFRIDGILYDKKTVPVSIMSHVTSRIKVLASIDIGEKRIPQDGKFSAQINNRQVDFRVSTFPTRYGEKIVVRILDRARTMIELSALGLEPGMLADVKTILEKNSGLLLTTGPTGSGKTTTLYAALSHLNSPEHHIITLEDPVEYHVPGITQGHIHPVAGFSFAKGLRALLRQDPDIIMVGEIRDRETARIALEAALTGHVVLSTLHTADAAGAITRLMDMGIEPFLINAALSGVVAQRLARTLCSHCKFSRQPTSRESVFLATYGYEPTAVYDASGCEKCSKLGYCGRVGIFELLVMSPALRELTARQSSCDQVRQQAVSDGMKPLMGDGLSKVMQGHISVDELIKAVA